MPDPLIFGFGDYQPAFIDTAMRAGMMRQPVFIALGAGGQLRQGNMIMRTPHIFLGRRSTPFW
jgi:hypothetical protein